MNDDGRELHLWIDGDSPDRILVEVNGWPTWGRKVEKLAARLGVSVKKTARTWSAELPAQVLRLTAPTRRRALTEAERATLRERLRKVSSKGGA